MRDCHTLTKLLGVYDAERAAGVADTFVGGNTGIDIRGFRSVEVFLSIGAGNITEAQGLQVFVQGSDTEVAADFENLSEERILTGNATKADGTAMVITGDARANATLHRFGVLSIQRYLRINLKGKAAGTPALNIAVMVVGLEPNDSPTDEEAGDS